MKKLFLVFEKNEKFTKVFEDVKKYGSTSYDDQSNKPKKEER